VTEQYPQPGGCDLVKIGQATQHEASLAQGPVIVDVPFIYLIQRRIAFFGEGHVQFEKIGADKGDSSLPVFHAPDRLAGLHKSMASPPNAEEFL
jgi:hypothetical protein